MYYKSVIFLLLIHDSLYTEITSTQSIEKDCPNVTMISIITNFFITIINNKIKEKYFFEIF